MFDEPPHANEPITRFYIFTILNLKLILSKETKCKLKNSHFNHITNLNPIENQLDMNRPTDQVGAQLQKYYYFNFKNVIEIF